MTTVPQAASAATAGAATANSCMDIVTIKRRPPTARCFGGQTEVPVSRAKISERRLQKLTRSGPPKATLHIRTPVLIAEEGIPHAAPHWSTKPRAQAIKLRQREIDSFDHSLDLGQRGIHKNVLLQQLQSVLV